MDLISRDLDIGSPVTLSMLDQLEPLELIWEKGPVEKPLWSPPGSTVTSQLAAPLLAPNEEESILIGEDEMAAWFHYPIDTADTTRVDPNRQTVAGTGNLPLPVLPDKVVESGCQVVQPVLPEKDANLDCQLGPLGRRLNCESKVKAGFEGHFEQIKQDSLTKSKLSTIGSNEKRKDSPLRSTLSRKSRKTEVHNLSEQKRRSRINEKMKTLQGLLPRINKLDKVSILDATIVHVKSLQKQVKMFSRRCAMRPPMFPIGPPYMQSMPSIGIGMDPNMSVGMNMAMCMQQGIAPFVSPIPYLHINQTIQAPMTHAGDPYHFPSVAPGQMSPQYCKQDDGKKKACKQDDGKKKAG